MRHPSVAVYAYRVIVNTVGLAHDVHVDARSAV
jgi:hypothetical protein